MLGQRTSAALPASPRTNTVPLTAALQRYLGITDADLTVALRASLLGAALAGQAWPACTEADLLCAAFDDGSTWLRGDRSLLTPQWQQALDSHLRSRAEMVLRLRNSIGVAQGDGAVRMLDTARVLPLLREAAAGWNWDAQAQVPDWVKPAVTGFARWDAMVEDQFARLSARMAYLRQLLPARVSGSDTAEAVRRAFQESANVGLAPSQDDAQRLNGILDRVERANWRVIPEIDADLAKADSAAAARGDSWAARVTAAARDRGESFGTIGDFLDVSDRLLDDALERAAARRDPAGDDAAEQVSGLLDEWGGLLGAEVGRSVTDRTPVLDRAVRLQNEVRRLEAGAQDQGQALRIARRVAEIQAALTVVCRARPGRPRPAAAQCWRDDRSHRPGRGAGRAGPPGRRIHPERRCVRRSTPQD